MKKIFLIKWINPNTAKFNKGIDETGTYKVEAYTQAEARKKFNSYKAWNCGTYSDTKIISVTSIN